MFKMHHITKFFYQGQILRRKRQVVQDVSLSLAPGETLGLIGPSGAGKSTIGKLAVRLIKPSHGRLSFEGRDITHASRSIAKQVRTKMQIIFQDPQASLHPGKTIDNLLREPLRLHRLISRAEEPGAVKRMLHQVGLNADILNRYPKAVSGGEKQRIVIARVMAVKPRFVVLDEPTSMLDVSVQANILHLLLTLQRERNMAYLYISHDMRLVARLCQRVAVVDQGRIVEQGPVNEIMARPRHACTRRLLRIGNL